MSQPFTCWVESNNNKDELTFNDTTNYNRLIPTIRASKQLATGNNPIHLFSDQARTTRLDPETAVDTTLTRIYVSTQAAQQEPIRNLSNSLLPPLRPQSGSSSQSISSHQTAELFQRNFKVVKYQDRRIDKVSLIWGSSKGKDLSWASESDIHYYVKQVLTEIIEIAGLHSTLECFNEFGLTGIRPDIWVIVTRFGLPIGVVEVKKPGTTIMDNSNVHGQIYDYMQRLSNMYGIEHVFGIVSTYQHWRVFWLPETAQCAESPELYDPQIENIYQIDTPKVIPTTPSFNFFAVSPPIIQDFMPTPTKRVLLGTETYRFDSMGLVPLLVSTILKMYHSPRLPVELTNQKRMYIRLVKESWFWINLKQSFKLKYEHFDLSKVSNAILIGDLRGGEHGRVWLAATDSGHVFVIKFSKENKDVSAHPQDLLMQEATRWKNIYNIHTPIITLNTQPALIMPYYCIASPEDWENQSFIGAVDCTIDLFVKKELFHNDLHRRHVGKYFQKDNKLSTVFIDLGDVTNTIPKDKIKTEMKKKLLLSNVVLSSKEEEKQSKEEEESSDEAVQNLSSH